ncbi:MAG: MurR/RpiR family transcriptional regulator [Zetaproteobacteria bacterium]|nr:MAG: MurR/RpiR family transcriptional regulator [Zetaproteobacteria bacterium]
MSPRRAEPSDPRTNARGVLRAVRTHLDDLRNSEKKVALAVLGSPDKVIYQSISELAENAGTSEPTVLRFCRALGFRGYHDLKIQLAQDLVPAVKNIHEDVTPGDDPATLIRKVLDANVIAINATLDTLDPEQVSRAIRALARAKHIDFFGLGGSGAVAMDAYHKFFRLGIPCGWQSDSHMQAMSAALMTPRHVVVVVSHSGSTKDIVESLRIATTNGATSIAIVSHRKSPVASLADIPLCVHAKETGFKPEPMSSRIAHLCVIDVLAVGVALERSADFVASVQKTRRALVEKRY